MIDCVLATDMSFHFKLIDETKAKNEEVGEERVRVVCVCVCFECVCVCVNRLFDLGMVSIFTICFPCFPCLHPSN